MAQRQQRRVHTADDVRSALLEDTAAPIALARDPTAPTAPTASTSAESITATATATAAASSPAGRPTVHFGRFGAHRLHMMTHALARAESAAGSPLPVSPGGTSPRDVDSDNDGDFEDEVSIGGGGVGGGSGGGGTVEQRRELEQFEQEIQEGDMAIARMAAKNPALALQLHLAGAYEPVPPPISVPSPSPSPSPSPVAAAPPSPASGLRPIADESAAAAAASVPVMVMESLQRSTSQPQRLGLGLGLANFISSLGKEKDAVAAAPTATFEPTVSLQGILSRFPLTSQLNPDFLEKNR